MLVRTRWLLQVFLVMMVCLVGGQVLADEIHIATEIQRDGVTLSVIAGQQVVYIQDRRTVELQAGLNRIEFDNIPPGVTPEAMLLEMIEGAGTMTILERQYRYDLNPATLLSTALNQTMSVQKIISSSSSQPATTFTGTLLDFRQNGTYYDVTLRLEDGTVRVLTTLALDNMIFTHLAADAILTPMIDWVVEADTAGTYTVEFSYLSMDFGFNTNYAVMLAPDNQTVNITGWLTLIGRSRITYEDIQIQFVSGQWLTAELPGSAAQLYDYTLQRLPQRVTIPAYSSRQILFLELEDIPVERRYAYNASPATINQPLQPEANLTSIANSEVYLEAMTKPEQTALLPAGSVRVYAETATGDRLFMRSTSLVIGNPIRFRIGNENEIVGKRAQTFFEVLENEAVTEGFEIQVRNDKDVPITVAIRENLVRIPGAWRVQEASAEYTISGNTITFNLDLAPGEEATITYRVRYTWVPIAGGAGGGGAFTGAFGGGYNPQSLGVDGG